MSDDLLTLLTQVAQILGTLIAALLLALQRWKAQRDADTARGQNQALRDLQEKAGVETSAPIQGRPKRSTLSILPRYPTPLPFWPIGTGDPTKADEAIPEAVDPECSRKTEED